MPIVYENLVVTAERDAGGDLEAARRSSARGSTAKSAAWSSSAHCRYEFLE